MLIELEPAFVLNVRPYRETSCIVDLFTKNHGRISLVARGVRQHKSKLAGLMQPFMPLLVSYFGTGSLYSLKYVEQHGVTCYLSGVALLAGFYLNELLLKFLAPLDHYPQIFDNYQCTLALLQNNSQLEIPLRYFEKELLTEIGYQLQLQCEADTQSPLLADKKYQYIIGKGVINVNNAYVAAAPFNNIDVYLGASLIALRDNNITGKQEILETKRLMRKVIAYYLDGKSLNIRKML